MIVRVTGDEGIPRIATRDDPRPWRVTCNQERPLTANDGKSWKTTGGGGRSPGVTRVRGRPWTVTRDERMLRGVVTGDVRGPSRTTGGEGVGLREAREVRFARW